MTNKITKKIKFTSKYVGMVMCMLFFMAAGMESAKAQTYDFEFATCGAPAYNNLTFANFNTCMNPGNVFALDNVDGLDVCNSCVTTTKSVILDFPQAPQSIALLKTGGFANNTSYTVTLKYAAVASATAATFQLLLGNSSTSSTGSTLVATQPSFSNTGWVTGSYTFTTPATGTFNYLVVRVTGQYFALDDVVLPSPPSCTAGTTSPALSATTKANACPATTVDLTTLTASNTPAGTTLTWHTGTPATTANKVTGTAMAAGTYYAAFFDATNNCYSGTSGSATTAVTATVSACCAAGTVAPTVN